LAIANDIGDVLRELSKTSSHIQGSRNVKQKNPAPSQKKKRGNKEKITDSTRGGILTMRLTYNNGCDSVKNFSTKVVVFPFFLSGIRVK